MKSLFFQNQHKYPKIHTKTAAEKTDKELINSIQSFAIYSADERVNYLLELVLRMNCRINALENQAHTSAQPAEAIFDVVEEEGTAVPDLLQVEYILTPAQNRFPDIIPITHKGYLLTIHGQHVVLALKDEVRTYKRNQISIVCTSFQPSIEGSFKHYTFYRSTGKDQEEAFRNLCSHLWGK